MTSSSSNDVLAANRLVVLTVLITRLVVPAVADSPDSSCFANFMLLSFYRFVFINVVQILCIADKIF